MPVEQKTSDISVRDLLKNVVLMRSLWHHILPIALIHRISLSFYHWNSVGKETMARKIMYLISSWSFLKNLVFYSVSYYHHNPILILLSSCFFPNQTNLSQETEFQWSNETAVSQQYWFWTYTRSSLTNYNPRKNKKSIWMFIWSLVCITKC